MKVILVTGASGFIGRAVCKRLGRKYKIVVFSRQGLPGLDADTIQVKGDIEDKTTLDVICRIYRPEVVIHCAGLAHQSMIHPVPSEKYFQINSAATENLAKAVTRANPDAWFMFLSSISVYGEGHGKKTVTEQSPCRPSSDYAASKRDAERKLRGLFDTNLISKIDIYRLAPVYDRNWSLNIDKRVFFPGKLFYLKYGTGKQKMSLVNRENVIDFIEFRLNNHQDDSFYKVFNLCDPVPYSFNEIIRVFRKSDFQPRRITLKVSLNLVWLLSRLAARLMKRRTSWSLSIYDKLANDLVFDHGQMLKTGFRPRHTLASVFGVNRPT